MTRTRFAPSPTGYLHIGGLRTAAYAFALAKHDNGKFLLRIEDTDQKRKVKGATEQIYLTLSRFGLLWDEEPLIQSVRAAEGVYAEMAKKLVMDGKAFYCQCRARNAKAEGYSTVLRDPCRDANLSAGAVKLRTPDNEKLSYYDFVLRKDVSWDSNQIPDTTLLKSDGRLPTYHLAMPVDDYETRVTHVIRGVEWLTSTPVHLLVFRYLGFDLPQIGHPSAILSPEGGKLSKRRGDVSVEEFLNRGYLEEAVLNFVILLGWAPKDNHEIYTLEKFVTAFDPAGFQKANPILNLQKLDWFNNKYIKSKSNTELVQLVKPFVKREISDNQIVQLLPLVKERMNKLSDFGDLAGFLKQKPSYSIDMWQGLAVADHLKWAQQKFATANKWEKGDLDEGLVEEVKSKGWKVGDFFMSLRIAICGSRVTPPITEAMVVLGQEESLKRIATALKLVSS